MVTFKKCIEKTKVTMRSSLARGIHKEARAMCAYEESPDSFVTFQQMDGQVSVYVVECGVQTEVILHPETFQELVDTFKVQECSE